MLQGKYRESLPYRFGKLPNDVLNICRENHPIWVHAVSVGEVEAAAPVVRALKSEFPSKQVVLSTVTETGQKMAHDNIPEADAVFYFPLDYSFAVRKNLNLIKPSVIILLETELWPNFLFFAKKMEIPVLVVNGRISDRSFSRYSLIRKFAGQMLSKVSGFSMQSFRDAERIISLGANPDAVSVNGNLKIDQILSRLTPDEEKERNEREKLYTLLQLPPNSTVIIAGSTHPGEEEPIIEAFSKLSHETRNLKLIIAPRRVERSTEIENIADKYNLKAIKITEFQSTSKVINNNSIIIVDTIGDLAKLYRIATVVFVGGSLVNIGGHNILEPVIFSKPVVFGPYMSNFQQASDILLNTNSAIQISESSELFAVLRQLLNDPKRRNDMGNNGRNALIAHRGATQETVKFIRKVLES